MTRRRAAAIALALALTLSVLAIARSSGGRRASAHRSSTTTSAPARSTSTRAPTTTTSTPPSTTTSTAAPSTTVGAAAAEAASAPTSTPAATAHGLRGAVITLNPGHDGGNATHTTEINRQVWIGTNYKACDTAGTETNDGYPEHAFTWDVTLRAAAKLRALGATVVLTRNSDSGWGPCIDERAAIGNRAHSAAVVSIHADGGPASGRGFFVIAPALIQGLTDDVYSSSGRLAAAVRDAVRRGTSMPTADYAASGGYMTSSIYGGLNLADVPAMFIECGNMRNATDAALLERASFRDQLATAIVNGIAAFVG